MSQPPNPGNDPQGDPQDPGPTPPQQPGPAGPDSQPPIGPDGQPYNGPIGPDGQPYNGPIGPDGQPYNGAPPPHQGTKFSVRNLISAIVVIAILGTVGFFMWQNSQKDAALAVGNCLSISGETDDADHDLVDCDDESTFSYYVGEVIEGNGTCTDPNAASYSISESKRGGSEKISKVACLVPQLFEGICYAESTGVNDLEPVDCDDAAAALKVTKVTDETDSECGDELEFPLSSSNPARTYCLASLEE